MRKAIKILAIIALGWVLVGYAIAGLISVSYISGMNLSWEYLEVLGVGMLTPILTFLIEMVVGIYLLVLSKKKYGPTPEIVLMSIIAAGLPICRFLFSTLYSTALNKIIYTGGGVADYIDTLNALSYSISYMSNGDFCDIGMCLLLVALSFAIAEKVVSKRHGMTLEEQYPSVDTIE